MNALRHDPATGKTALPLVALAVGLGALGVPITSSPMPIWSTRARFSVRGSRRFAADRCITPSRWPDASIPGTSNY